ncbi:hypothetical protein LPJ53_002122 [Coemansia erecta]|uniref:Uncharacterized protein n=1 Tax=Coemansia erecta TaxID=147472 RepID=A0A9W8CTU7_9FUNG|nr:hypothetical protein LPJ53_002122 [Coemansia erecta]
MYASHTLTVLLALIGICFAMNNHHDIHNLQAPAHLSHAAQGFNGFSNFAGHPHKAVISQQPVIAEPLIGTFNGQQGLQGIQGAQGVQIVPANEAGLLNGGLGQLGTNQPVVFFNSGSTAKNSLLFVVILAIASL